ncbi:hypothetical protein MP228_001559 [Amoeboaphelidium protococcarum]|nr:hypothetical protein MP228_001559 [Amoeboaphelidium protococcarum]
MDNQWKAQETAPRTEENVQEQLLRARNITEHPQPGYQGYGVMPQKGAGKGPKIALMPRRKEEQSQTAQAQLNREVKTHTAAFNPGPMQRPYPFMMPYYASKLGMAPQAYPSNFVQTYGIGPYSDHYYYGFTPKDVLLSIANSPRGRRQSPYTNPAYGTLSLMRQREIQDSRRFMMQVQEIFLQGRIPTNQFLHELIGRLNFSINRSMYSGNLSPASAEVLINVQQFIQVLGQVLQEKNYDEKLQSFLQHAYLSSMFTAQVKQRMSQYGMPPAAQQFGGGGGSQQQHVMKILMQLGKLLKSGAEVSGLLEMIGNSQQSQSPMPQPQQQRPMQSQAASMRNGGSGGGTTVGGEQMYVRVDQNVPSPQQFQTPSAQPMMRDYASALRTPLTADQAALVAESLRSILQSLQQSPELLQAVILIARMAAELGAVTGKEYHRMHRTIPLSYYEANRPAMLEDLKQLVQRFANGYSLDGLIRVIDQFQLFITQDWETRDYFESLQYFFTRCMDDPGYLNGPEYTLKSIRLIEDGRKLFGTKIPQLINSFVFELQNILNGLQSDPALNTIYQSGWQVVQSILMDPQSGQVTLKQDLIQDLRQVFLPIIASTFKFVALPRIEISDANMDVTFDNIVISLESALPNLVEVNFTNNIQMSPRPNLPSAFYISTMDVNLYQIQADLRNVEFSINKRGFPPLRDAGLADIFLSGNGLSITTKTAIDTNLWYTTLVPVDIKVNIDALRINLHDSSHDFAYRLLGTSLVNQLKKRICRSLEEQIFLAICRLDSVVTQTFKSQQ